VVNAILSDGSGAGTLLDDDPPPAITIADVAVLEGDSGTTNAVFQLTLSKPAIVDVSVRCTTITNTAATNDFTQTVTTVVFPAGTTDATFSVPIRGNTVNEPDETFFVNLSLPANATISRTPAVGTIVNDDAVAGRLDQPSGTPFPRRDTRTGRSRLSCAVDYLGNPATSVIGNTPVTARTESGFLDRLRDDFEDGDSLGWTNYNATFTTSVTDRPRQAGECTAAHRQHCEPDGRIAPRPQQQPARTKSHFPSAPAGPTRSPDDSLPSPAPSIVRPYFTSITTARWGCWTASSAFAACPIRATAGTRSR
jgi:hypothetical protein